MLALGALAATIAAVVALAGCGQASATPGGGGHAGAGATATPRATSVPRAVIQQGPPVTWQSVAMPPEVPEVEVAPSDGNVAYTCAPRFPYRAGTVHIWVTRDRGQHWSAGGSIAGLAGAADCLLTVDDNDASVLVATLNTARGGASPDPANGAAYVSFDGGAHWRSLGKGIVIKHVASYQGKYYAAYLFQATPTSQIQGSLAVSTDQMASWHAVGPDQIYAGSSFWLSPLNGSLLSTGGQGTAAFERSDDGGAHWTPVSLPAWTQTILAAPRSGAEPWEICAAAVPGPGTPASTANQLACSADSGQTWQTLPTLSQTNRSPKGLTYPASAYAFAIAGDGAVLVATDDGASGAHLYRLLAGTNIWQALGALNDFASCSYSSGPGAGVLWQTGAGTATELTADYPRG
jgi:hypothetical protein